MSFLTAEWRKLAMANYAIDPSVLKNYVPTHTEIDLWNGTCYASLVGFMFENVRIKGLKMPFHTHFEEVNLRFYVRYKEGSEWKRGVVFVKEIVPKHAITLVANILYKEHYETMPMKHKWTENNHSRTAEYKWKCKGQWQSFEVSADAKQVPINEGSEAEFITEHYWGYSKHNNNKTIEYEVTHPKWQQYAVNDYQINADFGLIYGPDFEFLNNLSPNSVFLAEGSPITIESKKVLLDH